uniref:Uncharacterized protein n=1 Tax=Globodera pallida TaxID=36090 RepID=A0A183BN12_GLOPA
MCAKAPGLQRGFSRIIWGCLPDQRGDYWAEEAKKEWFENVSDTELKGIECRAEFGEMGKNLSNANIQLPAVPKGLKSTTTTEKLTISTTTTTTEKTSAMTITGKPTTTSTEGGPMSSMKQLASTISAANVSFRSSWPLFGLC